MASIPTPRATTRVWVICGYSARADVKTCRYSTLCEVPDPGGQSYYQCSRDAVGGSEYCILHDSSHVGSNHSDEVLDALVEEVEDSRPLVGFHLPSLRPSGPFNNQIYFDQCRFYGVLDLSNVTMNRNLIFNRCDFMSGISFAHTVFEHLVQFNAVKFCPKAKFNFPGSMFKDIHIVGSSIAECNFDFVELTRAKFINNSFMGNISMIDAKLNNCDFIDTIFKQRVRFIASKFSGCSFKNITFHNGGTFESAIFDFNKKSNMDTDLTDISFLDADISGIRFRDHTRWDEKYGHRIYDVRTFYSDPNPDRFVSTLGVLRSLRDNYEYHLMYHDAGQFFAEEMELRRMYSLRKGKMSHHSVLHQTFSLTGLYYWICGYGESLKRVGLWMALLFGASFAYFALSADPQPESTTSNAAAGALEKAGIHMKRTLAAFFPLGGGDLPDYVVRATSVPLLGTMFIVIRRRLERKLRH